MNLAALLLAATLGAGASALEIQSAGQRNLLLRQGSILDIQVLDARERRRDFQERQQRYREEDSATSGKLRQPLEIPVIRRNCQVPPSGNNFLRSCR